MRTVWAFVENMDNWCRFLRGYQKHTQESDADSTWVLVGDVGAVARTVEFKVHIDDWRPEERVHFTLTGVNEQLAGEGTFRLTRAHAGDGDGGGDGAAVTVTTTQANWIARFARWVYRLLFGRVARDGAAHTAGDAHTRLSFHLRVTPGGPMGPMVDALLKPLMLPVAEELAEKIMAALEQRAHNAHQTRP